MGNQTLKKVFSNRELPVLSKFYDTSLGLLLYQNGMWQTSQQKNAAQKFPKYWFKEVKKFEAIDEKKVVESYQVKTGVGFTIKYHKDGDGIIRIYNNQGHVFCMYPYHLGDEADDHLERLNMNSIGGFDKENLLKQAKAAITESNGFDDWEELVTCYEEYGDEIDPNEESTLENIIDDVAYKFAYLLSLKYEQINKGILQSLFEQHQEFAKEKFTDSTWFSSLKGLEREIEEVRKESKVSYENWVIEYVDCMMYLIDSMNRASVEWPHFITLFKQKMEINKNREWKKNADNSYSHIK